jgi:hypothetical protein
MLFLVGEFNYYYHDGASMTNIQQKAGKRNSTIIMMADNNNNNIFEGLAKQFGNIAKPFEYTVVLSGKQIFPNDTLKQDVLVTINRPRMI